MISATNTYNDITHPLILTHNTWVSSRLWCLQKCARYVSHLRQYPTLYIPTVLRKTAKPSNHDSSPPAEIQTGKT
jgi:hypothetical protein